MPLTSTLSLLLTLAALTLLALSLRGRPLLRTPPRRCPRCWYDLAPTPYTRTCPECGHAAPTEPHLHKRRRSRRLAALSLTLLLAAYTTRATPRVRARGWIGAVPTTALVLLPPHLSEYTTPDLFYAVLDEVPERRLWALHRELLLRSCLRAHPDRKPGTGAWHDFEGSLLYALAPDGRFSLSQQRRLWTALAPTLLPSRAKWPADVPVKIGPLCSGCLDFNLFYGEQSRQLRANLEVPGVTLSLLIGGRATDDLPETPFQRESRWNDGTIDLGIHPPGTTIQARYQIIEHGRVLWDHTEDLTTIIVADSSDLLRPISSPAGADPHKALLDHRREVRIYPSGVRFTPNPNAISALLDGGPFAVTIELCRDDEPVATGQFWTSPKGIIMTFTGYYESVLVPLTGDLTDLLAAPDDDPSWTIRFRGDPETALRDPTATRYWSGEFTLTRDQFTVNH